VAAAYLLSVQMVAGVIMIVCSTTMLSTRWLYSSVLASSLKDVCQSLISDVFNNQLEVYYSTHLPHHVCIETTISFLTPTTTPLRPLHTWSWW
jgi:hypothetical protein